MFFVLSGFLITYLLLSEESRFGGFSIKAFYVRRLLRIWPLYLVICCLAFLVLPAISMFEIPTWTNFWNVENKWTIALGFLLMIPNVILSCEGPIPYVHHLWSIGVEEQFYLMWPIVMSLSKRHRLKIILSVIVSYYVMLKCVRLFNLDSLDCVLALVYVAPMAIGSAFGVIAFRNNYLFKALINNSLFGFVTIVTILLLIQGFSFPMFNWEWYSLLFGVIIVNLACNPTLKSALESRSLRYLGNISYGLYMYHPIAVVSAVIFGLHTGMGSNWFIYPMSFLITVSVSAVSYRWLEKPFLQLKSRFSKFL